MEPHVLTAVQPRPPQDVADLAVAVQANLVQLQAAERRQSGSATPLLDISVPSASAVTRFRETLILREVIAAYDDTARSLRAHEVWGQFCLFCWFFFVDDPHHPPDFNNLPDGQPLRCPGAVLNKAFEIERCLWRLRFEQRWRSDASFKNDPAFEDAYRRAQTIPAMVLGESVQISSNENLLLGACEYAGMLAAARWIGDIRWRWGQEGIMDLDTPSPRTILANASGLR